jgi:signal transduction histidine kinase
MKLTTKLILLFIATTLSTIMIMGLFLYDRLWNDRFKSSQQEISKQLDDIDFMLNIFFDGVENDVCTLAANEYVRSRDDRNFTSFLNADEATFKYNIGTLEQKIIHIFNTYRFNHQFVNSIYMGRENGSFVRSHKRERPTRYDPRERPWYGAVKKNPKIVVRTEPYPSLTTQDINIGVVKALVDEQGNFFGAVGIDVTLVNLTNYIYMINLKLIPEGEVFLLDRNGIVLASRDKDIRFRNIKEYSEELSRRLSENKQGVSPVSIKSTPHYVFSRKTSEGEWKIAVLVPSWYIQKQIQWPVLLTISGMSLGFLLLSILTLAGLNVFVLRPVKRFKKEIDDVTKTKNLDRTIKIHSRDEIGGLAGAFNKMINTLNQTQQTLMDAERELREHRDHLEDLVKIRTEQLALATERAEESDRLKSTFLATMSHELRTPLNSIIGFTGILHQGLAGPLNDEQIKQLGMVQNSAHHLLELINDVLDISKIEAGQLEIVRDTFDLRKSLDKVVNLVSPMAEKKGLPIYLQITDTIDKFTGDQRRVEQILINLLNNAIKFTEMGEIRVSCSLHDSKVILSVSDTGIGIKPEDIETIFKPFRQIDTGLSRKYEGTGLGLSITRKLVTMMGGEIQVKSKEGVGSTFSVILPIC